MKSAGLAGRFKDLHGAEPKIFRAPGRVNLIGEHTDYNDGFVMPCAIGFSVQAAVSARSDGRLTLRSENFRQAFEFDTANLPARRVGAWCDYALGVAIMLRHAGFAMPGANLLMSSDLPIGAGLSSSAAIEVATAFALLSLTDAQLPLPKLAKLCQRAENEFVGARVGIMDQFISCLGKKDHALLLDCRSLDFKLAQISPTVRLVICNTLVKHEISGGEYNRRRAECEQGVKILAKWYPGIRALRDITPARLEEHLKDMPEIIYKRCAHVVHENQRTIDGFECLTNGDLRGFGHLMGESHRSLSDLYEVSCKELNIMVESAEGLPGYWGGRMTGGGFGGCTVNLVNTTDTETFATRIAERYTTATGIKPDIYICSAADGAGRFLESDF
jgi:galactokinase